MMRVTRIATSNQPDDALRVEGRLTHQTADELRAPCEAILAQCGALRLDVSGLQFVDRAGVALLRTLERRGTRLGGCSGFLDELLRARSDRPAPSGSGAAADAADDLVAVRRLRDGDPAAFEEMIRRYGGRLLAAARRIVGSEEDARDCVQEAFFAAFRAIDTFNGSARLSTWLHRIVVNTALMKLRSRRRRLEEPIDGLLPCFDEEGRWVDSPHRWETPTDRLLEQRETRLMVRKAIDRLPESYRTVLVLRDIEELDTEEAAVVLNTTPNAVKVRLHRARQALRALLERELVAQTGGAAHEHVAARQVAGA